MTFREANNNTMLKWVLGLMVPVMLVAVSWIFGAGKHYTNICKIPVIEQKVNDQDKRMGEMSVDMKYIKEGIVRIERKMDRVR